MMRCIAVCTMHGSSLPTRVGMNHGVQVVAAVADDWPRVCGDAPQLMAGGGMILHEIPTAVGASVRVIP